MTQRLVFSEFAKRYGLRDKLFQKAADFIKPQPTGPWIVGGAVRRALADMMQESDFDLAFASEGQFSAVLAELKGNGFKVAREALEHVELKGDIERAPVTIQLEGRGLLESPALRAGVEGSTRKQQALGRLQFECDAFNMHVKVGDDVDVREDNGRITRTKTRSEAQLLGDGTPVIWLADRAGCFLLGRVTSPPPDGGSDG